MPVGLLVVATCLLSPPTLADIAIPTIQQFYFTRDDKPFEKPIDFTVACHGWMTYPGQAAPAGPRKIVEVYRFSAKCPAYGCELRNNLYLNYRHIEFCTVKGTAGGKPFTIQNLGKSPAGECGQATRAEKFERVCVLRLALPK